LSARKSEMEPDDIELLAREKIIALDMWRLPVDPFAIAREEGIELAPGRYGARFDARIKFIRSAKTFILFYKDVAHGVTEGRMRFSVGHELGHYYIPHHRAYLLGGHSHNSVTDFRSRDPREREADLFSSALLMPHELFAGALKSRNLSFCNLADLSRLAEIVFKTSLTSTVLRYICFDWEACSMVISEGGVVQWARHSDTMRACGMGWIEREMPVPGNTPTAQLWKRLRSESTLERVEDEVDADLWFERPHRRRLWEEAMPLGHTGQVLTCLSADDDR
jgi:hypothetical protein